MKKKFVILGVSVLSVGILCGYFFVSKVRLISDEVTAELGEEVSQKVSSYAKGKTADSTVDLSKVNVYQTGEYEAFVMNGNNKLKFKVYVKDTTPPEAEAIMGLKFDLNEQVYAKDLVINIEDMDQVVVSFDDGSESKTYSEAGTHTETIVLADVTGNMTKIDVSFEILADSVKPVLKGIKSQSVYEGETIDYLKQVKASDNIDGDLTSKIVVDSPKVNLTKAGKYYAVYSVTDSSGNTATKKKKITVKKDEKPTLSGIKDRTVYVNGTVDYMSGVKAHDKRDGDLTSKIVVDKSKVNLAAAGTYTVIYTVTDSSKNVTSKTAKVVVKENVTSSSDKAAKSPTSSNKSSSKKNTSSGSSNSSGSSTSSGGFSFKPGVKCDKEVQDNTKPGGEQNVGTW